MKFYRRDLEINNGVEMHLEVTHYLTPIEMTEEDLNELIYKSVAGKCHTDMSAEAAAIDATKAIMDKLKGE